MEWPFDCHAKRDDPLVSLRVPVVSTFYPGFRFVAAYLDVAARDTPDYMGGPPFASALRPTHEEAKMISSFIEEYISYFFNDHYQRKLAEQPLDADSGCNTTVFIKYGEDDWGYRRCSWDYGPTFVPYPPHTPDRGEGMNLEQVMDLMHTIGGQVMGRWLNWKATHHDIFQGKKDA